MGGATKSEWRNPNNLREYSFIKQFKEAWDYANGYNRVLAALFFVLVIASLINLLPAYLYGKVIGDLTTGDFDLIPNYLIILGVSYLTFNLIGRAMDHFFFITNMKIRNQVRMRTYNFLFGLDFEFYERSSIGRLMNQVGDGVRALYMFLHSLYRWFFISLFTFILALVALLYINPIIAATAIVTVFIFQFFARFTDFKKLELDYEVAVSADTAYGKVMDYLRNIQLVKFLNTQGKLLNELDGAQKHVLHKGKIARAYMNKTVFVQKNILDLSGVVVLLILANTVVSGVSDIGTAVMVYALYTKLISEFKIVRGQYMELLSTRVGMLRLSKIFENKPRVNEPTDPKKIGVWNEIRFDQVFFRYPSKKTISLEGVSFSVKKGEKVAIVGVSGSGKSTIAKLLFKAYVPDGGSVNIGNTNILRVKSDDLYRHMKIVPQDNELINATIYDNLELGCPGEVKKAEVIWALKKSAVWEFVKKLPRGLNTVIGESGINISGGEKQRFCLARALLSKPDILVLDEATSHLDVVTERKIHKSLSKLSRSITLLAITHRISSVHLFDRILVMEKGKVVGDGTHKELLKSNKVYQRLWKHSKQHA